MDKKCILEHCDRDMHGVGYCYTHQKRRRDGKEGWDSPIRSYVDSGNLEDRLRYYAPEGEPDECWEWTGWKNKGQGMMTIPGGKSRGAHIVAWEIANNDTLFPGFMIRHHCDNPCCTNPRHLEEGPAVDNVRDMDERGRRRPPTHCQHRTPKEVEQIKKMHADGMSFAAIGRHFGCGGPVVAGIVKGLTYTTPHPGRPGHNNVDHITGDDMREIRQLFKLGATQRILAERFSVSQGTISNIIHGRGRFASATQITL